MYSASTRSYRFEEEDDELASLLAMEAGFSSYVHDNSQVSRSAFVYQGASDEQPSSSSSSLNHSLLHFSKKQPSYSFSSLGHSLYTSSSIPARFFRPRYEDRRPVYFLGFCFLCTKRLSHGEDIFMYRDSAYCSEECRERKMEIDEAMHRKLFKFSLRKMEERSTKNTSTRPDRVAAA